MTLTASQVILYAADSPDYQIALSAAAMAGIPTSNVIGDFSTAWSDIASGSYLVLAVGGPALNAVYYNECGWSNPAGDAGGSTPFAFASFPRDTLPGANYFVDSAGTTGTNTLLITAVNAYYALNGSYPSVFPSTDMPASLAASKTCEGNENQSCPCSSTWSCGSTNDPKGVDISDNNTSATKTTSFWNSAQSDGYTRTIIKATEGTSYVSPYLSGQYSSAEQVLGISSIGLYHFLDWQYSGTSQAKNFYNAVSGLSPAFDFTTGLGLWLDVEEPNGSSSTGTPSITVVTDFLNELASLYGTSLSSVAGIYTNHDTWVNYLGNPTTYSNNRLWLSAPNGATWCPDSIPQDYPFGGWPNWTVYQYATDATVAGYSGFDVDEFR